MGEACLEIRYDERRVQNRKPTESATTVALFAPGKFDLSYNALSYKKRRNLGTDEKLPNSKPHFTVRQKLRKPRNMEQTVSAHRK